MRDFVFFLKNKKGTFAFENFPYMMVSQFSAHDGVIGDDTLPGKIFEMGRYRFCVNQKVRNNLHYMTSSLTL